MTTENERQESAKTAARRRLVGRIVAAGITDEGLTKQQAAQRWMMSRSTLHRLIEGEPNVSMTHFREVEIQLRLPRRLLRLIIEGSADAIRAMPDIDPVLATWVLGELAAISNPPEQGRNHHAQ